jgi:hypothetical protein
MPSTDFPFGYNLPVPQVRESTTDDVFSYGKPAGPRKEVLAMQKIQNGVMNATLDILSLPLVKRVTPYKHEIQYCTQCQTDMIVCGKCGNNCCNGGYGTLPDGTKCDACPEAYKLQDEMWAEQSGENE